MSAATRNEYRSALIGFANWCVQSDRLLSNPLVHVPRADVKLDPRRRRRALTEGELVRLLDVARRRPLAEYGRRTEATDAKPGSKRKHGWTFTPLSFDELADAETRARNLLSDRPERIAELDQTGRERALIYKTLVLTGLRKGELASVTVGQLDLDGSPAFLTLHAADEKNRQGSTIPLRADLADNLRRWLADKQAARQDAVSNAPTIKIDSQLVALRKRGTSETAQREGASCQPVTTLPADEPLFDVPDGLIKILNRDLQAAGIAKRGERSTFTPCGTRSELTLAKGALHRAQLKPPCVTARST